LQEKNASEQQKAQEEAERVAREEAARLADEADLKKTLGSATNDSIEDLSNKELIDVIGSAVEQSTNAIVEQVTRTMEGKLGQNTNEIKKTQSAIMRIATAMDKQSVMNEHKDFDEYQDAAALIMQENPGMSVRRAYILAKAEAVEQVPKKQNLERERPDTTITRSRDRDRAPEIDDIAERRTRQRGNRDKGPENRTLNFRSIIDAGVKKTLSARGVNVD
jgi:hypothetical protein